MDYVSLVVFRSFSAFWHRFTKEGRTSALQVVVLKHQYLLTV